MLGPIGRHEQRLGPRVDIAGLRVEQHLAHLLAERRTAGLPGEERADRVGQHRGLRGLSAPFTALEGDEQSGPGGVGHGSGGMTTE